MSSSKSKSPSRQSAKKNGHGKWNWGTPKETYNIPAKGLDDPRNVNEDEVSNTEDTSLSSLKRSPSEKLLDAVKFNREMLKLNADDFKAARLTLGRSCTGDSFESRIAAAEEAKRIADLNLNRIEMLEQMLLKAAAAFVADDEESVT
tara:strand:+ start:2894 stop:3334 length:441 start_codon:yes stop_codon:yes gene_type:complete